MGKMTYSKLNGWIKGFVVAALCAGAMSSRAEDMTETFDDGVYVYETDPYRMRGVKIIGCLLPAGTEFDEWNKPDVVTREDMPDDPLKGCYVVTRINPEALQGLKIRKLNIDGYGCEFTCPDAEGVEEIELMSGSIIAPYGFAGHKGLRKVKIHAYGCGSFAFQNASIETLELLKDVTYIGTGAFDGCSVGTLIMLSKEPPVATPESFGVYEVTVPGMEGTANRSAILENCQLMVPKGSTKNYRKAPGWSLFKNIKEHNFEQL